MAEVIDLAALAVDAGVVVDEGVDVLGEEILVQALDEVRVLELAAAGDQERLVAETGGDIGHRLHGVLARVDLRGKVEPCVGHRRLKWPGSIGPRPAP